MGIQRWQRRVVDPSASEWKKLSSQVKNCVACELCHSRTQTVFGVGNPQADLLIVGEAPGFYEDQQGEPFVGKAGQLLNLMLKAIGLEREQIYIANVLKCRPPQNRDPLPSEVAECTKHLEAQINLLQPKIILAVGRYAAHYLLKTEASLASLRGKQHHFNQIPLIVSYHPAYLLRSPSDKAKAFADLQNVKKALE